jgi:hypothetical protein
MQRDLENVNLKNVNSKKVNLSFRAQRGISFFDARRAQQIPR